MKGKWKMKKTLEKTEKKTEKKEFKAIALDIQQRLIFELTKDKNFNFEQSKKAILELKKAKMLSCNKAIISLYPQTEPIHTKYFADKKSGLKPRFIITPKNEQEQTMLKKIRDSYNKLSLR